MKLTLIALSVLVFSQVDSAECQNIESFYKENYRRFQKENLVNFSESEAANKLSDRFYAGKVKGSGAFGEVREVALLDPNNSTSEDGSEKVAIKRVAIPTDSFELELMKHEIVYLLRMCGNKNEASSNGQPDSWKCSGDAVVKYFGCYSDKTHMNIFQEVLYKDLGDKFMNDIYKSFDVIKRARILKLMALKFEVLHQNKLIHCDIKPENMMSVDEDLSDLRIIDLGLAREIDTDAYGGSPLFSGPEQIGFLSKAVPTVDIYSLGITFATMEGDVLKMFKGIDNKCFLDMMTFNCYRKIRKALVEALASNNLERLVPVILKAAAYLPINRYQSMAELAEAIENVIKDLEFLKEQSEKAKANILASPQTANGMGMNVDPGQPAKDFVILTRAKNPHQQVEEAKGKKYFKSFINFFSDIFKTIYNWANNTITDDNDNVNDIDGFLQRRAETLKDSHLYTRPKYLAKFNSAPKPNFDSKQIPKKNLGDDGDVEDWDADDEFKKPESTGLPHFNSIGDFKYEKITTEKNSSSKPIESYDELIQLGYQNFLNQNKQIEI